jgi:hypothetical protein
MKSMQGRIAGMVAATLAASGWGAVTVLSKGALEAMPSIALLAVQHASSVAFLCILLRGSSRARYKRYCGRWSATRREHFAL